MWLRWFPWKQVVSRAARARGLVDPIRLLSRFESFAQPIEVKEPLELLRAGMVLHARGLLNVGAIQHNLDWIWPYWVQRQYDPRDDAFIPRAFSLTHINLTHRSWTAIGIPDCDELPIVDPRGLLTPRWDGWSLDAWVIAADGRRLIPSLLPEVEQHYDFENSLAVVTSSTAEDLALVTRAEVEEEDGTALCRLTLTAHGKGSGWLVVVLRPFNPEGVSFVHDLARETSAPGWRIGGPGKGGERVLFDAEPSHYRFSSYRQGDVSTRLLTPERASKEGVHCRVGMATAAALFPLQSEQPRTVRVEVPLASAPLRNGRGAVWPGWPEALAGAAQAHLPNPHFQYLYDAALRSLVLHSPGEVYPGPYTYKRFWFRDSAFILHALLCAGMMERVERTLDTFPARQKRDGFFLSQETEWDSNGEALWILHRFCELTGRRAKPEWLAAIRRGAEWIVRKRLPETPVEPHAGLLPPGFSAEHLGPNDYYYWDDFWGVAGLRAAADLLQQTGESERAEALRTEADHFLAAIERSLAVVAARLGRPGMPASPYRRLDSGAIGSLAAGYPVQLFNERDPRLLDTAEFLHAHCLVHGGFYLDIIHSGINPYLSLHLAQVLLRAGDLRSLDLIRTVAQLASPTGQWPEAVHPRTGGGCMGDGHHTWASAEWVLMLRNCFVREEGDRLVLASGVLPEWLEQPEPFSFGPAPTPFGVISVSVHPRAEEIEVRWSTEWRTPPAAIEVRLPGFEPFPSEPGAGTVVLKRAGVGAPSEGAA